MEYEEVLHEKYFKGKTNLIVSSFGMASFIEDTPKMLRTFYEWLKPGGKLILSFYNKSSILLNLEPNWRDTSLSAHLDIDTNTLRVELTKDSVFQIYCKPFDGHIKDDILKIFEIEKILTFTITLAFLPNDLLKNEQARKLFLHIDKQISDNKEFAYGHYVMVVAKKKHNLSPNRYKNVLNVIKSMNIEYELIKHDMVFTIDDVIKQVDDIVGNKIKTLIIRNIETKSRYVIVLPHNRKLNIRSFAKFLEEKKHNLRLAMEKNISELGFDIGGIPPFGYEENNNIRFYIDQALLESENEYSFIGVGINTETLKLKTKDFLQIVKNYQIINVQ